MTMIFDTHITDLAGRVVDANRSAGRRIALAESCTGGLVAAALTEVPGASDVFSAGYVTYSNAAKIDMVDVNADLIDTFGAVSMAVAWAMAQGALARSGADIAVAISGVAGPGGGTDKKPVGTVVFARALRGQDPEAVVADRRNFGETLSRSEIRTQALLCALELLLPREGDVLPPRGDEDEDGDA
jgi:nicotinamide-nucleotide amidase